MTADELGRAGAVEELGDRPGMAMAMAWLRGIAVVWWIVSAR